MKADVLRKESIDENANTIHVMRRILLLKNKEDDDELKAKRRREEVERLGLGGERADGLAQLGVGGAAVSQLHAVHGDRAAAAAAEEFELEMHCF